VTAYRVPETIGAYLFDIDGTLYTHDDYVRFQSEVLVRELSSTRGEPYEVTAEAIATIRRDYAASHNGATTSLGNAMAALGIDIATSVAWRKRLIVPSRFLSADPLLHAALARLRDGIRGHSAVLVAVTNNPRSVGDATLEALGEPYLLAASLAGSAPASCLSVGDRYDVDLAIPLQLGMGAILVSGVADVYGLPDYLASGQRRAT